MPEEEVIHTDFRLDDRTVYLKEFGQGDFVELSALDIWYLAKNPLGFQGRRIRVRVKAFPKCFRGSGTVGWIEFHKPFHLDVPKRRFKITGVRK